MIHLTTKMYTNNLELSKQTCTVGTSSKAWMKSSSSTAPAPDPSFPKKTQSKDLIMKQEFHCSFLPCGAKRRLTWLQRRQWCVRLWPADLPLEAEPGRRNEPMLTAFLPDSEPPLAEGAERPPSTESSSSKFLSEGRRRAQKTGHTQKMPSPRILAMQNKQADISAS